MIRTQHNQKTGRGAPGRDSETHAPIGLPVVVSTIHDVDVLLRASLTRRRMPKGRITLAIPQLTEQDRRSFQRKLNAYAHACGCKEGSIAGMTALAIAIASSVFTVLQSAWFDLIMIWLASLILVPLCVGVGKMVGKFVAHARFRRLCTQLMRAVRSATALA